VSAIEVGAEQAEEGRRGAEDAYWSAETAGSSWLGTGSPCSWDGLCTVLTVLLAGATGADVLTMFRTAETGPVLASHPSWHPDESVGIPVPNMRIVPADPDTGEPVDVLWELLDRAMVSAWSPSRAVEGLPPGPGVPAGARFAMGVLAASDPNGMLYLVDER
jgi:hypothetical protein